MPEINLESIYSSVSHKIRPFYDEMLSHSAENIHSIHMVGSAVTDDYDEKYSDVNSIVVLKRMDLKFVELIAPLGKKYGKKKVAAPLIMTPDYILRSLDVFPIEFLDFKLIHKTVFGEDIISDIMINLSDLRHQCEREIKVKLIGLRQGYISSQGDMRMLTERFVNSIVTFMPLFRGIIQLMGMEPPVRRDEVINMLNKATGIDTDIFGKILDIRKGKNRLTKEDMNTVFERYYMATEKLGTVIDELNIQ